MKSINNNGQISDAPLWDIVFGITAYPAVLVSYQMGIFEKLDENPMTLEDISNYFKIEQRPAEILMSMNTSLNLLHLEDQRYFLTDIAKTYLLKESPTYFGSVFDTLIGNPFLGSVDSLKSAVVSNKAQTYADGDVFDSHEEQAEQAKAFTLAMHSISVAPAAYWPDIVDFSKVNTFLDIGGGSGAHTISVLKRWEHLSGIIFDFKTVCDVADEFLNEAGLSERASSYVGDLWDADFPDADVHFYSQIFHDWDWEKCQFLAKKSFDSLPVGGKIILHEILYNDNKTGPFAASAASVSMLLWTEGRQYSRIELVNMLENAGFKNISIEPGFSNFSLVIGEKV